MNILNQLLAKKQEVILCVLALLIVGLAWANNSARNDNEELKSRLKYNEEITQLEARKAKLELEEKAQKERFDSTMADIANADLALANRRAELDRVNKTVAKAKIDKLTTEQVSNLFKDLGYPNRVSKEVNR